MDHPFADLELLLVHADTRRPVADGPVRVGLESELPKPTHLGSVLRPNSLRHQGWALVAPEGDDGDALIRAVDPLVRHRCAQVGADEVQVFRAPATQTQVQAIQWRRRHLDTGSADHGKIPEYLLILGDLHQVPVELQKVLATRGNVGRLAFDRLADYEAYAHKVVRWEERGSSSSRGRVQFFTARDGTNATRQGFEHLVVPATDMLQDQLDRRQLKATSVDSYEDPAHLGPQKLLDCVQGEQPTLLFTLNHGLGPLAEGEWTADRQRVLQGGMSFGEGADPLLGEDLRDRAFLPGGVWFMLSCYGAGTPHRSDYHHWLVDSPAPIIGPDDLARVTSSLAGRPFIASLPKAALASENGPLAVVGHVDLAWGFSYREAHDGSISQTARFVDVLVALLDGARAGLAFRELYTHLGSTNLEITARSDQCMADGDPKLGVKTKLNRDLLWLLRQDLSAYILLGDPAVQLPVGREARREKPRESVPDVPSGPVEVPDLDDAQRELERAIGLALSGEESPRRVARKAGLSASRFREIVQRYKALGRRGLIEGE